MRRLVVRIGNEPAVPTDIDIDFVFDLDKRTFDGLQRIFNQLCDLTDILGDDYDPDHLRDLVQADRDGRCVVLPCKKWAHLGGDEWCCSSCGNVIHTEGSWEKPGKKYCEECGAKMDLEE